MNNVWVIIANKLNTDKDIILGIFDSKKSARDVERHYNKLLESYDLKLNLDVYTLEYKVNNIDFADGRIIKLAKEDI